MSSLPHVAIVFSSGMGHLMPVTRLAVTLSTLGCSVTIIVPSPVVSDAESRHLSLLRSSHPHIRLLDLHLLPYSNTSISDPFFLQWTSISNSAHLLPDLLSSIPTLSALIIDIPVSSSFSNLSVAIGVPAYVLVTTSAGMLATIVSFSGTAHVKVDVGGDEHFVVPGIPTPIPLTAVPPFLLDSDSGDANPAHSMGGSLLRYSGILINTLSELEAGCLSGLNAGEVVEGLPEVIPVGILVPYDQRNDGGQQHLRWLDSQPDGSVVYVSVGSRTVLPASQMEELRRGLEMSGVRYLFVTKSKIVDKDEDANRKVLDEAVSERGLVVTSWVEQEEVLKHRAVGGFVSHCGWNSVTEAVWEGVPVLAWPQHGDQVINATVVNHSKVGRWVGWHEGLVKGEEIAERVREFMEDEEVKDEVRMMKLAARRAAGDGGCSHRSLVKLGEKWKKLGTKIFR